MAWHTKTEAALAADVQQAEDKAAAEAEAQRQRCAEPLAALIVRQSKVQSCC